MDTTFRHSPLLDPSASIRLLEVNTGKLFGGTTRFRLRHVDIKTPGEFIGVSYTWGDPGATNTIKLANHKHIAGEYRNAKKRGVFQLIRSDQESYFDFPVAKNLHDMLNYLWLLAVQLPGKRIKRFWIDAICINQQDVMEKNSQLQLMGQVYATASCVIVWLGSISNGGGTGEDSWLSLNYRDLKSAIKWVYRMNNDSKRLGIKTIDLPETEEFLPTETQWRQLVSLFSRPWFSRLWVLQEATLPLRPERLIAFCDLVGVSFDALINAGVYLAHCDLPVYLDHLGTDVEMLKALEGTSQVQGFGFSRGHLQQSFASEMQLSEKLTDALLSTSGNFNCTDDRDRIYALYGMLGKGGGTPAPAPDYTSSVDKILTDVARFLIESTGTLTILAAAPGDLDSPSWVPNWKRRARMFDLDLNPRFREHTRFKITANGRKMGARLAVVGEITSSDDTLSTMPIRGFVSLVRALRTIENRLKDTPHIWKRYSSPQAFRDGFAFAALKLLCGPERFHADFVTTYNIILGLSEWPAALQNPGSSFEQHMQKNEDIFRSMQIRAAGDLLKLVVFITSEGFVGARAVALPMACRLYVAPGSPSPLVLVPEGRDWRIHESGVEESLWLHGLSGQWHDEAGIHLRYLESNTVWDDVTIV